MTSPSTAFERGLAHHQAGQPAEAEACYRSAIEFDPLLAEAHNNLGNVLQDQGRLAESLAAFQQAARLRPDSAAISFNLGNCCQASKDYHAAEVAYCRALAIDPAFAAAHYQRGVALQNQSRFAEAVHCHREALRFDPGCVPALNALGVACQALGNLQEARTCYERALAIHPHDVTAQYNLAATLQFERRLGEAQVAFERCTRLLPDNADMRLHLGKCLQAQGKFSDALACYAQAIERDPNHKHAHYFTGTILLANGDFAAGWPEYEWRLKEVVRDGSLPVWNGERLNGSRLLIYAEWGLGDTLQFIRYVPFALERADRVFVEVQSRLIPLLAQSGFEELIPPDRARSIPCDWQVPLLSLPKIFGTELATIPARTPYLAADPELVEKWRRVLAPYRGFRIGICWQGSPIASLDSRAIPLVEFAALGRVVGVELFSLQCNDGLDQWHSLGDQFRVVRFADAVDEGSGAFLDTAAIMKNLDLVVTCDTAIAHLAGGLGVPVWVALLHTAEWRWLRDRDDSPWYPSMRLFRQPRFDDWRGVFEWMAAELPGLMAARELV